jgi:hypothetical protein
VKTLRDTTQQPARVGALRDAKIVDITVPKPAGELLSNFPIPSPWLCRR